MAFSLKNALTHVPFDDSILFEVYRSIAPVVVASIGVRPCDAFICTSRAAAVYEVYIAFLDTLTKTVHVFASDAQESGLEEYKGLMQEANQFLSGLGFSLEKVNIDFSPGIRQVVIRDIRVMHPPAQCPKARIFRSEQKEGAPVKKSVSISGTAGAAIALPAVAAESIAAAGAAAAAVAAAAAHKKKSDDSLTLWVEKDAPRQEMHILQKMFSEVSAELAVLREERQNSEAELRGMRDALVRETLAASRLMEELDQLREANSAREALLEERVAAVETELHKAQKEVAATRKKLRETRSELKDYAQSAELAAVVEVREEELHRLTEELALVREAAAAVECRLNAEVETVTAELAAVKLDAFNDRQRWDREVSDLQGELQVAKDSFAEAQAEQEKRHHEVLARKEEEMLHVTEEKNRLRERQGSESAELRREVVLLRDELEDARCRHEEEKALLLTECRQARQEAARLTDHLQLLEKVASEAQSCVGTSTRNAEDAVAAIELEVQHLREAAASREAEHQASIAELQAKLDAEGGRAREADETLAHLQKDYRRLTMERPTLLAAARKAKRLQEEVRGHVERDQKREAAQVKKSAESRIPVAALPEEITPVRVPEPAIESSDATFSKSEESGFHMDIPSWDDTLSALMADGCGFAPADFGNSGIDFLVDPTVQHVDIASAEDIIAIYESMNHVQAMPDGRGLKRCGAYVCVIRTDSGPRVFNVWSLVEEGKALVALPSQSETSDSWEGIIKDALFYFESVGFIMEPVDLASNRQKNRAMTKVPILRKRAEHAAITDFQSRAGLDLRREQQVVVAK